MSLLIVLLFLLTVIFFALQYVVEKTAEYMVPRNVAIFCVLATSA